MIEVNLLNQYFTLIDFVADNSAFALVVDVLVAVGTPTNTEDTRRSDTIVSVTFKTR